MDEYQWVVGQALRPQEVVVTVFDVGANNTREARYHNGQLLGLQRSLTAAPYDSSPKFGFYGGLGSALLRDQPDVVVVAAAGPVTDQGVTFTNLELQIVRSELEAFVERTLGRTVPVLLVNDATAGAAGLLTVGFEQLVQFNGQPQNLLDGKQEVIVAILGTGMGTARLMQIDGQWFIKPLELSHLWTRPLPDRPLDGYFRHLHNGTTEIEHLASGMGLGNIAINLARIWQDEVLLQTLEALPRHDLARRIATLAQRPNADQTLVRAMEIFRYQLGTAISALCTNLSRVVIAGSPVSCNLGYLLESSTDNLTVLQQVMYHRSNLVELVRETPVYAVEHDPEDAARNELNLLGAGLLGTSTVLRAA